MRKYLLLISVIILSTLANAQFTGTYYIGNDGTAPGGGNPNYSLLSQAVNALKAGTITGNVNFYVTSNIIDTGNVTLGINTNGFTFTLKPYTGTVDTITFTKASDNAGVSGAFIIGAATTAAWEFVETRNVVIDGSNTVGGTTRDLVIRTAATAHGNLFPIRVVGPTRNLVIKNIKVNVLQTCSYGIVITNRFNSPTTFCPDSVTIDNCEVTNTISASGQGIAISNSNTPTTVPTLLTFSNNKILAKTRGIFLNYAGNSNVFGNEVSVEQSGTGFISYGIMCNLIGASATDTNYVTNIYNNKIVSLKTGNASAGDYGIAGIYCGSRGVYNVYNNMISGFGVTSVAATVNFRLAGIRINSASSKVNAYYNTIFLPELTYTGGAGTQNYSGIWMNNGLGKLFNNIVVSASTLDTSFAVYRTTSAGELIGDYNNYYVPSPGFVGVWKDTIQANLAAWRLATGQDYHSISKNVNFVSPIDLHLTGASIGDNDLVALPYVNVTTDIDGQVRHPLFPYMGADEHPEAPIPVELVSMSAQLQNNSVLLTWSTATETNNKGFEVEKKINGTFKSLGFVSGNGTSTERHNYQFVDNNVEAGNNVYRLKQIDNNGTVNYSNEVEINSTVPQEFALYQNYPNPFNPQTNIKFNLATESRVKLEVYSANGELVKVLVDEVKSAGSHIVSFNATDLASGIYFYKISAGNKVDTKKMILVK